MTEATELPEGAVAVTEPPLYKLTEPAFIGGWYLKANTVIEFDGEPGSHMEPMNESAKTMLDAYYKAKPEARVMPVEALQITPGANPRPQFAVVGQAPEAEPISFVDMAERAGYTDRPAKVVSLAEAQPGVRT